MYVVYDNEHNETETFKEYKNALDCYEDWKQNYYDDGFLPEENKIPITISKVIKSAKVVKDDIDDEGEQLYCFEDVVEKDNKE